MVRDMRDKQLLAAMQNGVTHAGAALTERFRCSAPPVDREATWRALRANDLVSEAILRPLLASALPAAGWGDEGGEGPLPDGDWWVCDPSEGNINHIQWRTGWCVTATLVRDNRPLLTAVHLPLEAETYTAAAGQGAFCNGELLRVSSKSALDACLVSTGQALPGEDEATRRALEAGIGRMLDQALLVRMSVPATIELLDVASGRLDAFWQPSAVRSGLLSGALLVHEAGGVVSDLAGEPWTIGSSGIVAAAPRIHAAVVAALAN